jgi:hypothetical protein
MGFSVRVFFVDGAHVVRIPLRRYEQLWPGSEESMPERAGQRVHCATAYVEFRRRIPVSVCRIDYTVVMFDSDGRPDASNWQRQTTLASWTIDKNLPRLAEPVVEIGPYLAVRRIREELRWTPTIVLPEILPSEIG